MVLGAQASGRVGHCQKNLFLFVQHETSQVSKTREVFFYGTITRTSQCNPLAAARHGFADRVHVAAASERVGHDQGLLHGSVLAQVAGFAKARHGTDLARITRIQSVHQT